MAQSAGRRFLPRGHDHDGYGRGEALHKLVLSQRSYFVARRTPGTDAGGPRRRHVKETRLILHEGACAIMVLI